MTEFLELLSENFEAVIGVAGTLLGTILGWGLGKIPTGRLTLQITSTNSNVERFDRLNKSRDKQEGEIRSYKEEFVISLYNSSNEPKTIRELFVVLKDEKNTEILRCAVKDASTTRLMGSIWETEQTGVINLTGKTGKDIKAFFLTKEAELLLQAKSVWLEYKDEKFRTKQVILRKNDYSVIPLIKTKDKENNNNDWKIGYDEQE